MELMRPKLILNSLRPLRQIVGTCRGVSSQTCYRSHPQSCHRSFKTSSCHPSSPSLPFHLHPSIPSLLCRHQLPHHRCLSTDPRSPPPSTDPQSPPPRTDADGLDQRTRAMFSGLCAGDRGSLARAITLVETTNKEKAEMARKLMNLVTRHCRHRCKVEGRDTLAFRVGLSGPPGAGKSTFIEALGAKLTSSGHRLAVLAVDPSSATTGGSLLGDKTRMHELSRNKAAYIRPSPSRGHLGGVARNTNEAVVLCEAAGYDIVLVETVGVGQSEFLVSDMVDMFCLILPPAGGDELQGLKRGIVEQSDLIVVNKADGNLLPAARRTAYEYTSALKFMRPRSKIWRPKVKLCSSLTGEGLDVVWEHMDKFRKTVEGEIVARRAEQRRRWMWTYVTERLVRMVRASKDVGQEATRLEEEVRGDEVDPGAAADRIIQAFLDQGRQTGK